MNSRTGSGTSEAAAHRAPGGVDHGVGSGLEKKSEEEKERRRRREREGARVPGEQPGRLYGGKRGGRRRLAGGGHCGHALCVLLSVPLERRRSWAGLALGQRERRGEGEMG